ncbi:DUF5993 family protein [Shewanella benthica]|uniref:DUF5993 family protein n=1 Tax=Shewanella TaxID=22 RepID=UPI0018799EDE|nr:MULTISPECIES: DUF5993 family protein [Shewanella]MBE7216723.1 hypothetical protein [Shewanella benthica]MCJ8305028.1 DUF5993 family protein [Shewanella sp.]MCL1061604.1 DUF5993 family protein [Shewanella benthica]
MMALIFCLFFIAMVLAVQGKRNLAFYGFGVSLMVSLYWFSHHATDTLSILL